MAVPVVNPNIGELVEDEEEIEEPIKEHQEDEEMQDVLDALINEFNMEVQPEGEDLLREVDEPEDNYIDPVEQLTQPHREHKEIDCLTYMDIFSMTN